MAVASWIVWMVWMAVGLAYELYAVRFEHRNGALPLTRVVRDRLMRKHTIVKVGVMVFLTWLWLHFVTNVHW